MACTHSYMDFRHGSGECHHTIPLPESLGCRKDPKREIVGTPEKGNETRSPGKIGSMGRKGEGVGKKRGGEEEGRGGHGGAGRLSQGKNRGEQDEKYHNRGSNYRFEERSL